MNAETQANALTFVEMIEVLDYQRTTFHALLKGPVKMQFNNFNSHLQAIRGVLTKAFDQKSKTYLDDKAALVWELLYELRKAEDPRMILAVAQAYNAGQIKLSGRGNHKPINEMSLEEIKIKAA